jgi:hypothetical protein
MIASLVELVRTRIDQRPGHTGLAMVDIENAVSSLARRPHMRSRLVGRPQTVDLVSERVSLYEALRETRNHPLAVDQRFGRDPLCAAAPTTSIMGVKAPFAAGTRPSDPRLHQLRRRGSTKAIDADGQAIADGKAIDLLHLSLLRNQAALDPRRDRPGVASGISSHG